MEPSSSKNYTFFCLFFLVCTFSYAHPNTTNYELDEDVVKTRIAKMTSEIVEPRYDIVVKSYLRTYLTRARSHSENIIGRSVLYFPIFEKYLKAYNLPTDLKYLAIVESALNPKAVSRAGAVGLWQFMPPTGRELGLKIDKNVDERCDPIKSTEAAMRHLQFLYNKFDNWALVLAAYNSGSGRISRAMKRARTNNYWSVRRYLPRETHNYVPAFIAATYLANYFEEHEIVPAYPALDMQMTETIQIYDSLAFEEIVTLTELPIETVTGLNPTYRKGLILPNEKGNYLILPTRVMSSVKEYLKAKRPDSEIRTLDGAPIIVETKETVALVKSVYVVQDGETLEKIAQQFKCTVRQLKAWNQLKVYALSTGQELTIFQPKDNRKVVVAPKKMETVATLTPASIKSLDLPSSSPHNLKAKEAYQHDRFLYYQLKRREKLKDIAIKTPGVLTEELEQLNQISGNKLLPAGTIIKIKRL